MATQSFDLEGGGTRYLQNKRYTIPNRNMAF